MADIWNGATPNTEVPAYWNGTIPFCTPTDITETAGKYLRATARNITTEGLANCPARLLPTGTILVCSRATIGEIRIAATSLCTNQGIKALVCGDAVSGEFLYYLLLTLKSKMVERATGSTFLEIGRRQIASIEAPFPPLIEQQAIAEALSDADRLLEASEALIAKKRALKRAATQQLLTGRTRLPGFSEAWPVRRFAELVDVDPENLPSHTDPEYRFDYISLEDVNAGRLLGYKREIFRTAPSRARRVLRCGDVLMSTVRPTLRAHLLFRERRSNVVCSTGFAVLRSKKGSSVSDFVFQHLFGHIVNEQVERILAGSNYPAITSRDVLYIEIPCPPPNEQRAIATVLADMDAEIDTIEQRLDKTRAIKQGMMQQLLTGRVRLVEQAATAEP